MRVLPLSLDLTQKIVKSLDEKGHRAADGGASLPYLGSMVAAAGDGDHVDIGSLFGASAIMAALIKKEMGFKGKVYCIDPYPPDRPGVRRGHHATDTPLAATPELLMENANDFDVELTLIQKPSHPWPSELENNSFASAYIDGDHLGDAPWNDFVNLSERTTGYIGTDNYEEEYMDVVTAMDKAAQTDEWFLYYKNMIFYALRRVMPLRSLDRTSIGLL